MSRAMTWVSGKLTLIVALLAAIALMAVTVGFAPAALAEEVEETAAVEAADIADAETDDSATTAEEPVTEPETVQAPAPELQPEPETVTDPEPTEPRAPPAEETTSETVTDSASTEEETASEPVESDPAPAPQAATPEREAITAVPPPVVVAPTCGADGYVVDPVDTRYWLNVVPAPDGSGYVVLALTDITKYYFELPNGIIDTEHFIAGSLERLTGDECDDTPDTGNGDEGDTTDPGTQPGEDGGTTDPGTDPGTPVDDGCSLAGIPTEPDDTFDEDIPVDITGATLEVVSYQNGTATIQFAMPEGCERFTVDEGTAAVTLRSSASQHYFGDGHLALVDGGVKFELEVPPGDYELSVYVLWWPDNRAAELPYSDTVYEQVTVAEPVTNPDTGNGDGGDDSTNPVDETPTDPEPGDTDEGEDSDTGTDPGTQPGEDEDDATPEAIAAEWAAKYPGSTGTVVPVNAASFTVPALSGVAYPAVLLKEAASIQLAGAGFSVPVAEEGGFWKFQNPAPGSVLTLPDGKLIDYAIVLSEPVSTGDEGDNGGSTPTPGADAAKNHVDYWETEYPGTTGVKHDGVKSKNFTVPAPPAGTEWVAAIVKAGSVRSTGEPHHVDEEIAEGDVLTHPSGKKISHVILLHRPVQEQPTPDTDNGDGGENGTTDPVDDEGDDPGTQPDDDPYDDSTNPGDNPSGGGQDEDDKLLGFTEHVKSKDCIVKVTIENPNDREVVYSIVIGEGEVIEVTVPANGRETITITDLPAGEHSLTIADRSSSVTTSVVVEECVVDEPEVVIEPKAFIAYDCDGTLKVLYHNKKSTIEGLFETAVNGTIVDSRSVPAGEKVGVPIEGVEPGSTVVVNGHDAELVSEQLPLCEQPTEPEPPVAPEPPVDEPTDEEPQAPKPPTQPTVVVVVVKEQPAPPVIPGYQVNDQQDERPTEQFYAPQAGQVAAASNRSDAMTAWPGGPVVWGAGMAGALIVAFLVGAYRLAFRRETASK